MPKRKPVDIEAKAAFNDYKTYRLKISLLEVDPPIWRRLEVYGGMEMDSLASAIDSVFGWSGDHAGTFKIKDDHIGDSTGWLVENYKKERIVFENIVKKALKEVVSESKMNGGIPTKPAFKTGDLFAEDTPATTNPAEEDDSDVPVLWELVGRARTKFTYNYDPGDNWEHAIEVEAILPPPPSFPCPRCTDGARANPIEDCGGAWKYNDLAEAAGNPKHELYDELLDWVKKSWDPEMFSIEKADHQLAKLFKH